ncbi:MAG: phosphate/phosphite/phosphonate ABC transporter substrate-binding protein [Myxococcota bacterium]
MGVTLLVLVGCGGEPSYHARPKAAEAPATARAYTPPAGFTTLRVGLTPYLEPGLLLAQREPFRAWLAEELGVAVELRVAASYDDLGARMAAGEVDVGEFSPYAFVRARETMPGLVPMVSQVADGSTSAAGYVVVRADSPLRTLEELAGKRLAFVDPASTTGYLLPTLLLADRGVKIAAGDFLGNHPAVLLAVHEGRYDAGAVYQGALDSLEESHEIDPLDFRVIAKTPRIPRDILCARPELDATVRDELTLLLLALSARSKEGRELLGPMRVNGFVAADVEAYAPIREAAHRIGAL